MRVRSLPIRVDPVAGESIQSWLRMLAHRNEVTWTQIVQAVGLHGRSGDGRRTRWSQRLHEHEIAALAHATDVDTPVLQAMTLAVFDGTGITTGRRPRNPDYGALHGLRSRSRYCPRCLDDSGGRWQLRWYLGYTFVCPKHQLVLADTCPGCGYPPHPRQPTAQSIPQPLQCEHRVRRDDRSTSCGTDLRNGHDHDALTATPPMLHAQRVIDAVIDEKQALFGVYGTTPVPASVALDDVRALATRMQRPLTGIGDVAGGSPTIACLTSADAPATSGSAFRTAVAITAAVGVLCAPDVSQAGQRLRPLIAATRAAGRTASATSMITSRRPTSNTLIQVQLHGMAPWLSPTDLLRYRVALHPRVPYRPAATLARSVHALPALLWPSIALRLCSTGVDLRAAQAALSVSVALVGSRETLAPIANLLGNATTARAVSHIWALMRESSSWDAIQRAVIRLADDLHEHDIPIDYQRRRCLNYTDLLPDTRWNYLCRTTDSPAGRPAALAIARTALFTRISGCAADQAPWFQPNARCRSQLARFTQRTTPLLRRELDDVAAEFLAGHRIDEPLVWAPSSTLLADLDLPGADPDTIDVDRMHRLLTHPAATIAATARRLQSTADMVQYLADLNPCPPSPNVPRGRQLRRIPGLNPAEMTRLHHDHNLADLARRHDMSRQTLNRIAVTLGVDPHPQGRTRIPRRDRDWLARHYEREHRTIPEIAQMAGVSATTVTRWMRHYGITVRPRGTGSHRSVGAAHRAARTQPALLQPALRDPCGWERLRRFATAMQHPTLTAAARALNTSEPVLSQQFWRLEAELGSSLYHRAERGHIMRPNAFGLEVLTAISSTPTGRASERRRPLSTA
jgi:hypothetical protein